MDPWLWSITPLVPTGLLLLMVTHHHPGGAATWDQLLLQLADVHLCLLVIPKRNSVFSVEIGGFTSFIYGSKFEQRASERSAKKFKVRGTIDL